MIPLNFPSKSPMLPAFNINLFDVKLDVETTKQLAEVVIAEETNIINNVKSTESTDDPTWLTGKLWSYNFLDFDYPCITQFNNFIFDSYKSYMNTIGVDCYEPVYIQCWVNILKNNGRIIQPHNHANAHCDAPYEYSYVSGNISIRVENTSTFFAHPLFKDLVVDIPNKTGELIMFPSFMIHGSSENKSETPRITIAFDIITEEVYNMVDNHNFRLLTNR
jgi:hypothetical protein